MNLRAWLGPLGRYRPGLLRRDMAAGFHNCDLWTLPSWTRLGMRSPEEKLLDQLSLAGKVVYDVGAFNGAYSLFFSRRVGRQGRVVAFEPHAAGFRLLVSNLGRNQVHNVLPLQVGLGEQRETGTMYMLPGMPTTASLAPEARTPLRRAAGSARVETLDALVAAVPLPAPHFIKVDVEGYELEVLHGARLTLAAHRPDLLIEVHGAGTRHKSQRMLAIRALLLPLGYSLLHAESGGRLDPEAAPTSGHIFAHAG